MSPGAWAKSMIRKSLPQAVALTKGTLDISVALYGGSLGHGHDNRKLLPTRKRSDELAKGVHDRWADCNKPRRVGVLTAGMLDGRSCETSARRRRGTSINGDERKELPSQAQQMQMQVS